jgi:DNA-binding NarL/FixJ family response regulator
MTERQTQVIAMHQRGMRNFEIARELGLSTTRISQIVRGFYLKPIKDNQHLWQEAKVFIESVK